MIRADLSQLHNVRQQLSNQGVYMKNAGQAEQLLNVADSALKDIHATLTEARELAVQYANEGLQRVPEGGCIVGRGYALRTCIELGQHQV